MSIRARLAFWVYGWATILEGLIIVLTGSFWRPDLAFPILRKFLPRHHPDWDYYWYGRRRD